MRKILIALIFFIGCESKYEAKIHHRAYTAQKDGTIVYIATFYSDSLNLLRKTLDDYDYGLVSDGVYVRFYGDSLHIMKQHEQLIEILNSKFNINVTSKKD